MRQEPPDTLTYRDLDERLGEPVSVPATPEHAISHAGWGLVIVDETHHEGLPA